MRRLRLHVKPLCVTSLNKAARKSATDNEYLVRADQAVVDRLLANNGKYLNDVRGKVRGGIGVQVEPDFATGQLISHWFKDR